jgi:chemotaxis protein MotA
VDIATIIGLVLGIGAVVGGQVLEGGSLYAIMQPTAAIIVFGGTLGAICLSFPLKNVTGAAKAAASVMREPALKPHELIDQINGYANKARREGILSLEKELESIQDPFLKKAIMLAIDGVEPKVIRETLETDLQYMEEYGSFHAKIYEAAGGYSPTVGILGAVLGLIHVMENLSDPSQLGGGIAVAFVATVYGVGSANLIFLPVGNKLKIRHRNEMIIKEMMLEGVVAVSVGENPRLIEDKLKSFLAEMKEEPPAKTAEAA